jgi:hypothetical protein
LCSQPKPSFLKTAMVFRCIPVLSFSPRLVLRSSPGMPLGFLVFAGSVARDREKEKEKAAHVECIMSDSSGPPPLVSDSEEDWGPGPRVRQDDSETSSEDSDPRPWDSNAQLRSSPPPRRRPRKLTPATAARVPSATSSSRSKIRRRLRWRLHGRRRQTRRPGVSGRKRTRRSGSSPVSLRSAPRTWRRARTVTGSWKPSRRRRSPVRATETRTTRRRLGRRQLRRRRLHVPRPALARCLLCGEPARVLGRRCLPARPQG